jgi:hypothetical protein
VLLLLVLLVLLCVNDVCSSTIPAINKYAGQQHTSQMAQSWRLHAYADVLMCLCAAPCMCFFKDAHSLAQLDLRPGKVSLPEISAIHVCLCAFVLHFDYDLQDAQSLAQLDLRPGKVSLPEIPTFHVCLCAFVLQFAYDLQDA